MDNKARSWWRTGGTVLDIAIVAAFAVIVVKYVILVRQFNRLLPKPVVRRYAPMDQIPRILVNDSLGSAKTLTFANRTILVVLQPGCDACETLAKNLRRRPDALLLINSTREAADSFAVRTGASNPRFTPRHGMSADVAEKISTAPQIIVVEKGEVVRTCANLAECSGA